MNKVSKEIRKKKQDLSIPELREACAEFSRSYIEKQRGQFTRLGILADWENRKK